MVRLKDGIEVMRGVALLTFQFLMVRLKVSTREKLKKL